MREFATSIVRELRQRGFQAYFAGGCVRDMVLGLEPADYDVTTDATPNEVMRIFPKTYAVGAQFGVVLVPIPEEIRYETLPPEHPHAVEVATFRSDGIYSDGRHPDQVQYSKSPQEDVQRRDFTINGLLMDPLGRRPGAGFRRGQGRPGTGMSCAPSASRSCASAKTSCACCAPCASPRASAT